MILLFVVGALALDQLNASTKLESVSRGVDVRPTALQAFASASESAKAWRGDVRLVGARARCRGDVVTRGGQVEWAFQFFSPSTQQLALFVVGNEQVRQIRERLSPYPVDTLSVDAWQVDSQEALDTWWHSGGDYLATRRPDTEVTLRLYKPREGRDGPTWAITGSVPNQESSLVVRVDASEGTILD